jgi:hypothetical protein
MFDAEVYAMKRDMMTVLALLLAAGAGWGAHWALTAFG